VILSTIQNNKTEMKEEEFIFDIENNLTFIGFEWINENKFIIITTTTIEYYIVRKKKQ
jgi:hypothetical protein